MTERERASETTGARLEHDYVAAARDAASRYALGEGATIAGRGVPLHVWRTGRRGGVPLVLAHGLFGSIDKDLVGEPWLWPLLGPTGPVDLVLYDARGHGRSGAARSADGYAWAELGRDLLTVLDALGLSRAVFGGSSLGAATAIAAAGLAPNRVAAMLLFVPPPLGRVWVERARPALVAGARVVREGGIEALLRGMEARPENRSPRERPRRWAFERAHFAAFEPERLATLMEGVGTGAELDLEALRAVEAPALVVHHAGDPDHPVDSAHALAMHLRAATLRAQPRWDACLDWPGRRAAEIRELVTGVA